MIQPQLKKLIEERCAMLDMLIIGLVNTDRLGDEGRQKLRAFESERDHCRALLRMWEGTA